MHMNWILITLIAPLLWSILNHTDKYLISNYAQKSGVGGLIVYSSLFAFFVLPVAYIVDKSVFSITFIQAGSLIISGVFISVSILLYLYALQKDEASNVVALWFLIPVIAYILGIIFLGEYLTPIKILGALITIFGAIILSIDFKSGLSFRFVPALLMFFSSLLIASSDVMFKDLTINAPFWQSVFWNQLGMFLFGVFCFVFIKNYRSDFLGLCNLKTKKVLSLNIGGEILQSVATVTNYYATLLAPISLVLLIGYTFQPLFVFIEGVILTILLPKISKENISFKHLMKKFFSIVIMMVGVYIILMV